MKYSITEIRFDKILFKYLDMTLGNLEKNKDYNHITKRCNTKCPTNKTRNAQFKCVTIEK